MKFVKHVRENVPFYSVFDDFPGVRDGITTRLGGVSGAHLASLNLGLHCGDAPENVRENMLRAGKAIGFFPHMPVLTNQKHTAHVHCAVKSDAGIGYTRPPFAKDVDALITRVPNLPLFACFADCVPILFYDPIQKAAGVCHSGWRGTVAKIGQNVVDSMRSAFGSRPSDIRAAIGPCIGSCCFAVDAPVYHAFLNAFPAEKDGFSVRHTKEKTYIDLTAAVSYTLHKAGVLDIACMNVCTACHDDMFFSHRKTAGKRGCFAAIIMLEEEKNA